MNDINDVHSESILYGVPWANIFFTRFKYDHVLFMNQMYRIESPRPFSAQCKPLLF